MIIARSPLRISIGGGGTDLQSYYKNFDGFVIAAAINKYVYITLHQTFQNEIIAKYSQMERVKSVEELKHPIIREALKACDITKPCLEITSMADIPAGTGLGSSGSFTTALLRVLYAYQREIVSPAQLAERACYVEIDRAKIQVGKQDQYIATHGGITCFEFCRDETVKVNSLKIPSEALFNLEDNLILFFTGYSRAAADILKEQDESSRQNSKEMIENLHYVKELGFRIKDALEQGMVYEFGKIMNEHWQYKKQRSKIMSNPDIDHWYELALKNGAVGGKLVGAGGGGFLLFYAEDKVRLRHALREVGLQEIRFAFDFEGTKIID
jgi:D-glycero-alpha-D-manno-heptose-7-phosphate kinase